MDRTWNAFAVAIALAGLAALGLMLAATVVVRLVARRRPTARKLSLTARYPFRLLVLIVAVWIAIRSRLPDGPANSAWDGLNLACRIVTIIAAAWLFMSVLLYAEGVGMRRQTLDRPDNRAARRVRTQLLIIRRLTIAAVAIAAIAGIVFSLPGVPGLGTSLFASAGVFGIIAGLAAQSTLGNLFAGLQVAFSDAIRIDDVVVVEQEWGWIEEITLSYVVVHLWDDRRLVLPSTYFTTTPFQNWTRRRSELLGAVEFDLDWRVSPSGMRDELDRILETTDLWDGRVKVLQVTDAVGGWVRIRILVTAADAPTLFDLRCFVRERMIEWLQANNEGGLPRHRVESVQRVPPGRRSTVDNESAGLFSGSDEADARAARITGDIPVVRGTGEGPS